MGVGREEDFAPRGPRGPGARRFCPGGPHRGHTEASRWPVPFAEKKPDAAVRAEDPSRPCDQVDKKHRGKVERRSNNGSIKEGKKKEGGEREGAKN